MGQQYIVKVTLSVGGPGRSVGIATGYGLDGPGIVPCRVWSVVVSI
jgi:hypothetical protein